MIKRTASQESQRLIFVAGLVIAVACLRLFPHLPNMVPVTALALFAGAKLSDRRVALLLVFVAMFISDLIIGFDVVSPFVYLAFAGAVLIGHGLIKLNEGAERGRTTGLILAGTVSSSLLFFVVTNFGVWLMHSIYPKTVAGLVQCFAMAIPFFRNSLVTDLAFAAILFSVSALAERRLSAIAN